MDLSTPLNQLVDIELVMKNRGYKQNNESFYMKGDNHRDCGPDQNCTYHVQLIKDGHITTAHFLGTLEHTEPVLSQSYLSGISLDKMVQGLMHLGIGHPTFPADYAILPILYAINMLGIESQEDLTEPQNYSQLGTHLGLYHKKIVSIDSCVGHVRIILLNDLLDTHHDDHYNVHMDDEHGSERRHHEESYKNHQRDENHHGNDNRHSHEIHRDDSHESRSERLEHGDHKNVDTKYRMDAELHDKLISFAYARGEQETKRREIIEAFRTEFKKAEEDNEIIVTESDIHGCHYVSVGPLRWNQEVKEFDRTKTEYQELAQPILQRVRASWTTIIRSVNNVSEQMHRSDLRINPSLIDIITDYALHSRYNSLSHKRTGHY